MEQILVDNMELQGLRVSDIDNSSSAKQAGIKPDSLIIRINNISIIDNATEFFKVLVTASCPITSSKTCGLYF